MDIFSLALRFLCAAAAGFLVMSLFGVQALVALCSSIPLAKRRKKQEPDFDLSMALGRIVRHPALQGLPFCLETPNDLPGYAREIALMREMAED